MSKLVFNIDHHTAPQLFEYLRWRDQQKQKRHGEALKTLQELRNGQAKILDALNGCNADAEMAQAAREAMADIQRVAKDLDAFTPGA